MIIFEESDWVYVVGRLFMMEVEREVYYLRGFFYGDFFKIIRKMIEFEFYDERLFLYIEEELY